MHLFYEQSSCYLTETIRKAALNLLYNGIGSIVGRQSYVHIISSSL